VPHRSAWYCAIEWYHAAASGHANAEPNPAASGQQPRLPAAGAVVGFACFPNGNALSLQQRYLIWHRCWSDDTPLPAALRRGQWRDGEIGEGRWDIVRAVGGIH
jgi:hypothetical protein